MGSFVFVLEIIGVIAASISGSITAMEKHMDVFGVMILGTVTAVGGGVTRDLILGITPPAMFRNPVYAIVAVIVALFAFLPMVRKYLNPTYPLYRGVMNIMDTIGLASFTVVGMRVAYANMAEPSMFLTVFVGCITGVGGGVLRDLLAGNVPGIFVKHIYACASIAGAMLTYLLWNICGEVPAMLIGSVAIVVIRFLAMLFHWNLPRA